MTLCEAKWCSHLEETTFDVDLQGGGGVSCDTGYQPKISLKLIFHNIGLDVMPGYETKVSEFEAEIPIPVLSFVGITRRSIIIMRTSSCQR